MGWKIVSTLAKTKTLWTLIPLTESSVARSEVASAAYESTVVATSMNVAGAIIHSYFFGDGTPSPQKNNTVVFFFGRRSGVFRSFDQEKGVRGSLTDRSTGFRPDHDRSYRPRTRPEPRDR